MKMHKNHIAALVTLACLAASSTVFAATPEANVPDPVKGDAGIQMNRMHHSLEMDRLKQKNTKNSEATKNKMQT